MSSGAGTEVCPYIVSALTSNRATTAYFPHYQSCFVAIFAPSAIALNFAQTTVG